MSKLYAQASTHFGLVGDMLLPHVHTVNQLRRLKKSVVLTADIPEVPRGKSGVHR